MKVAYKFHENRGEFDIEVIYLDYKIHSGFTLDLNHYCGYAIFDGDVRNSLSYEDYCHVHGSVTLCEYDKKTDKTKIGFDCAHYNDNLRSFTKDREWLREESYKLGLQIVVINSYAEKIKTLKTKRAIKNNIAKMEKELSEIYYKK